MIRVTVSRDEAEHIRSVTMTGHAESGPYGYDLVCAGASAVSFGAVNAMASLCHADPAVDLGAEGGYFHCVLPEESTEEDKRQMQLLAEGMIISLETIADQYGEFISIEEHRR